MQSSEWSSPVVLLSRALLAVVFVPAGLGKVMAPGATAAFIDGAGLPASPTFAVLVGLFEIAAGLMVLAGYRVRWAALALAAFTLAASLIFHAFWSAPAEQQYLQQLLFSKNLGVLGSLLMLTAHGAGAWSVDEARAERRVRAQRRVFG